MWLRKVVAALAACSGSASISSSSLTAVPTNITLPRFGKIIAGNNAINLSVWESRAEINQSFLSEPNASHQANCHSGVWNGVALGQRSHSALHSERSVLARSEER